MAAAAPKRTVKTATPQAKEVNGQETAKPGPPTFRSIAKKVARMSLEDPLRIFVKARLMTEEEAEAAVQRASRADRSERGKGATTKGRRKSSS